MDKRKDADAGKEEIRYVPYCEELYHEEIGAYRSFGICAYALTGGEWNEVARVCDVATDLALVVALCERCNRGKLAPIHLIDVIMDALNG